VEMKDFKNTQTEKQNKFTQLQALRVSIAFDCAKIFMDKLSEKYPNASPSINLLKTIYMYNPMDDKLKQEILNEQDEHIDSKFMIECARLAYESIFND
jgi:hypothetical protein